MPKPFPIGNDQFREIREHGAYYADKSQMIRDFIETSDKVTLITRPRRFGKTLGVTMMRDFFDITQDSRRIFEGLSIMDTEYREQINSRPVIFFSFKDCGGRTPEDLRIQLNREFLKEYDRYFNLFDGNIDESRAYESIFMRNYKSLVKEEASFSDLSSMIENLTRLANQFYKKAPLLLIDEYDQPIISSYEHGYREELDDFFAVLYGSALKSNENLWQALLTGIQRVAKESIFSKLNNIRVYSVLDKKYSGYFGLTAEETGRLLGEYGLELNDPIKKKYDGYRFGDTKLYNPWSVLNYADTGELRNYWINTSTNSLIHESLKSASDYFMECFDKLIGEGIVEVGINLETSFIELKNDYSLWGLLINSGYLTVLESEFHGTLAKIKIPNDEVAAEFQKLVENVLFPIG